MTVEQMDALISEAKAVSVESLEGVAKLKFISREETLARASNGRDYDLTDLELYVL